jgi:uncharacterized protein (DUF2267 family)
MPIPVEYQRATEHLRAFLVDVRDACGYGSTHMAYTTVQAVFQAFRRRLTLAEAIRFAGALPAGMRALFVADWDPCEARRPFVARTALYEEIVALRPTHNFSAPDAIRDVAMCLWRHVDGEALTALLAELPEGAAAFWRVK